MRSPSCMVVVIAIALSLFIFSYSKAETEEPKGVVACETLGTKAISYPLSFFTPHKGVVLAATDIQLSVFKKDGKVVCGRVVLVPTGALLWQMWEENDLHFSFVTGEKKALPHAGIYIHLKGVLPIKNVLFGHVVVVLANIERKEGENFFGEPISIHEFFFRLRVTRIPEIPPVKKFPAVDQKFS